MRECLLISLAVCVSVGTCAHARGLTNRSFAANLEDGHHAAAAVTLIVAVSWVVRQGALPLEKGRVDAVPHGWSILPWSLVAGETVSFIDGKKGKGSLASS